ncbi:hypothetical protein TrST_g6805 [Triparma strigata]|uniref:Uncharacterized protein n=1 Tax=Triparma strigata TaxID=1606541 RepID=A0A9W7AH39_9STRA|nr:hypothetical protein TrST_g6805 [Triparma strigata]
MLIPIASTLSSIIILLSYICYNFWSETIVPQKRLELSKSKRTGEIKSYLTDLKDTESPSIEKWLLSDWLNPEKKENAIPFLKDAKWNSGDNPVVATAALLLIPVLFEGVYRIISR